MKNIKMFLFVVLTSLLRTIVEGVYVSFPATSVNADADITEFHRLVVDPVSGTVFVGARNYLHQLDADLRRVRTVVTGPRLDNHLCTESFGAARCGSGGSTVYDALPTDNINKVIAVVKHVLICLFRLAIYLLLARIYRNSVPLSVRLSLRLTRW